MSDQQKHFQQIIHLSIVFIASVLCCCVIVDGFCGCLMLTIRGRGSVEVEAAKEHRSEQ
jgi:hypothetical protein